MAPMPTEADAINLTHHFLIAMPGLQDASFARTVVYLCEHSARGALGLVTRNEDDREAVAGIQRGLDDFESGRFRPFGEVAEEQVRKHGLPESS